MPTRVRFDRFYSYAELQETLEAWAGEFPGPLDFTWPPRATAL